MKPVKFRDDIDPANTWVTSDTHYGHDNIIGFCHRPEDHEQVMIAEWRKEVPDDATLIHLGDVCYRSNARFKHLIAKELTGERKLLIRGNHDNQRFSFYKQSGFNIVSPFSVLYKGAMHGRRPYVVSFSHYPWNPEEDGAMQGYDLRLHGHIHNNGYSREAWVPFIAQHVNLSVEQTKYRPVNLKLLLDAVLLGEYPQTTEAQIEDARSRKEFHQAKGEGNA